MDLQSRKILFVQEFLNLQNEDIIQSLEDLLKLKKVEKNDTDFLAMSYEQFNLEIDQSMEDSFHGRIKNASELKVKYSR